MSEWFSKASNVFRREVSETPQPFEVHCECGKQHTGIRRSRHQHIVCKSCGSSLFVLPRDVYPPPLERKSPPRKKKKRKKESAEPVREEIDLSPVPTVSSSDQDDPTKEFVSRRRRRQQNLEQTAEEVAIESRPNFFVRAWQAFRESVHGFWTVFWEFWTPHRKIALLIFCFIGVTIYYSIYQSQLRQAVTVVKTELDAGMEAVKEQDWVTARRHFEQGTEAVDLLERNDLEANSIRQYFRETRALTRLTSKSLIELVEEAESTYVERGAEAWQEKFEGYYQDDWYIIEGAVRPSANAHSIANGYNLELVFPWAAGERRRSVSVNLNFETAIHLPRISSGTGYDNGEGIHTVFSGQLKEFAIGPEGEWNIRFNPSTTFFWVHRETYEATHLQIGSIQTLSDQQAMFERQAKWMGVKK